VCREQKFELKGVAALKRLRTTALEVPIPQVENPAVDRKKKRGQEKQANTHAQKKFDNYSNVFAKHYGKSKHKRMI
jgi:hypothetical protein